MYDSSASSLPTTPTPNPVSAAIGSSTGSDYIILFPITAATGTAATLTSGSIPDGLSTAAATAQVLGATMDQAALSITDFNFFRLQMLQALNLIDQSIRDIVSGSVNCP